MGEGAKQVSDRGDSSMNCIAEHGLVPLLWEEGRYFVLCISHSSATDCLGAVVWGGPWCGVGHWA